jgi:hypothetical protein
MPKIAKGSRRLRQIGAAKALRLHVFSQLHGCYAWQNARIVSNAVWNARRVTGVLEMIHTGKGWTQGA